MGAGLGDASRQKQPDIRENRNIRAVKRAFFAKKRAGTYPKG